MNFMSPLVMIQIFLDKFGRMSEEERKAKAQRLQKKAESKMIGIVCV
jgi:hypothetical protein